MRVLVVRNDRLGDLCLALPCFEVLARGLPGAERWAFVPEYTREIAELSPFVDRVLLDPGPGAPGGAARALAGVWRKHRFDALLVLLSRPRTALAGALARIPVRVAPATRAEQLLHNVRVRQRRSRAERPEFAYNVELAATLVRRLGGEGDERFTRPVLPPNAERAAQQRAEMLARLDLPERAHLIAIHPGCGGSAPNLTPKEYGRLARSLHPRGDFGFVVTAGPGEEEVAEELRARLADRPALVHVSQAGLAAFAQVLAAMDLVVGGSTGPLHLAGALDVPTAVFYVRRPSGGAVRWRTLSRDGRRLAFAPPPAAQERDVHAIDLDAAAEAITVFLDAADARTAHV